MPHFFALLIAGAGLYAGYRWVSRTLADAQRATVKRETAAREAMAKRGGPKDLGKLEYDAETGAYRPRSE